MFTTVFQRLLGGEAPANKVQEVKSDAYGTYVILQREEGLILYGPATTDVIKDKKQVYEIVLLTESNTSYSLYRAPSRLDGEEKYTAFIHRLPQFVIIVKEYFNVNGLQKICDILIKNPSWSLAHLICYFNLKEYMNNDQILQVIDDPDYHNYMTPFQLAVRSGNIEIVKELINNQLCKIDHLDNNSLSVFHYAAGTTKEMINLLTSKSVGNLNHCNSDGYTPLHLACLSDKPDCVTALILAGADVNITVRTEGQMYGKNICQVSNVADFLETNPNKLTTQDMKHGGTPLHWSSSREVVESLIERDIDINALNFDRRTALHIMVARNRLECICALLSHEAEIDLRDKDGNTALHIAVEKKLVPIVQCLVVFGCDINMLNKDGKSPRHMVGKDASGSADDQILYILHSVGAKRCAELTSNKCPPGCNAKGVYNGIPPAKPDGPESREHIMQVLASTSKGQRSSTTIPPNPNKLMKENSLTEDISNVIDLTNEQKGQSVMDAILAMFTTPKVVKMEPSPTQDSAGEENLMDTDATIEDTTDQEPEVEEYRGRGRLLCLDGGGIRGLILAQMLVEIEKLAQTPISHMFDWIAGTSTGGILALALGCGKTMRQSMCLYLRMKEQAFVGSRPYSSDNLEAVLKENLGANTVMADIQYPRIMVTAVMADRKPVELHLFRNYKCASDILGIVTPTTNRRVPPPPPEEQLVWKAARATGAAPSYFRASERFLDGGLIANNPTLDAMTEIHEYNMALRSIGREKEVVPTSIVISLGTGLVPVTELKEIDVFRPDSIFDTRRLALGLSAITTLLVDQATASDGRVVDRARAWCSTIGVPYFRFNPQMSEEIAMDEKTDAKLVNMMWEAKAYMHANRNKVIEMINLLK